MEKTALIFTLDAKGIRICESASRLKNEENRTKLLNTKFKSCVRADFFTEYLVPEIKTRQPSMLFFITSNESTLQSYFHSDLLKNTLTENNYTRLNYSRLNKTDLNSVNISFFVRDAEVGDYLTNKKFRYIIDTETFALRKYGALAIKFAVQHDMTKKHYCFVAVSLPMDDTDEMEITQAQKLVYLSKIHKKLVLDARGDEPNYLIMAGDFGYLIPFSDEMIRVEDGADIARKEDYIINNKKSTRSIFNGIKEGVDDNGPEFYPTYEAKVGRNVQKCNEYKTFREYVANCTANTPNIGWPSRILYKERDDSVINCTEYASVDFGEMNKFNSLGVMSTLTFL